MRLLLLFFCVFLGAACSKQNGPQRLDFVGTARYTSSNRGGLNPADTLASRIYADGAGKNLGRLTVTVQYTPRRDPFLYPTPPVADSIDQTPDPDFIYLDTALVDKNRVNDSTFLYTNVFGVRTTTGVERWQYDLFDKDGGAAASRAVRLSMRRADSLLTYQDYTLRLPVPAGGVSARRFLQLQAGLALPAYTLLGTTSTYKADQRALQGLTDLIVLPDGLTLVAPDLDTTLAAPRFKLNARRWNGPRRATRIYLAPSLAATSFAAVTTNVNATILGAYAAATAGSGQVIGPVQAGQVYAFRTGEPTPRYGLLLVVSIPSSTATSTTLGLQLQVRMAKVRLAR